jgi:hypothetical protein
MSKREHDGYGKKVLQHATNGRAIHSGPEVETHYGTGGLARIDGVCGDVAIEVEARVPKQVRGAVLDLICHSYSKKLLLLMPANMKADNVAEQCRYIMRKFCAESLFRVLALKGCGGDPRMDEDSVAVKRALAELDEVQA